VLRLATTLAAAAAAAADLVTDIDADGRALQCWPGPSITARPPPPGPQQFDAAFTRVTDRPTVPCRQPLQHTGRATYGSATGAIHYLTHMRDRFTPTPRCALTPNRVGSAIILENSG